MSTATMTQGQKLDFSANAALQLNLLFNSNDFKISAGGLSFRSAYLGVIVQLIDRDNYTDHAREICTANDNPPPTRERIDDWWKSEKRIKIGRSWYAVIEQN